MKTKCILVMVFLMAFVSVAKANTADDFNGYKKACDQGFAWGCSGLGYMYSNGQGVKQDYFAAADLFKKACDVSYAEGCFNLGNSYSNGQGVRQDYFIATDLYKKACDGGVAEGCLL